MIKKVIIGLILLVCICSGAFSVIYHYNPTNTSDIDNTDSSNIIGNTNNEGFKSIENNPLMKYIDHIDDTLQYSYGYVVNVNGELRHYINDYGVYYLESEGLTDRYILCVECGGFQPIGEITNPLPKAAICHHDTSGGLAPNYKDYSVSRDEAYTMWIEAGKPVCDEKHLSNFTNLREPIEVITFYCKDCDGHVFLENYDEYKEIIRLYNFPHQIHNVMIIQGHLVFDEIKLCSHYDGTLDLHDASIEDFHSGWFVSNDDYNHWLEESNKVSNEDNVPIDDNIAPIESNDFTPDNTVEDLSNNTV